MASGIAKVKHPGSAGQVMVQGAGVGMWDFLYASSTVKPREWDVGDRVILPDGRVFRFGLALDALVSYHGCGASLAHVLAYTAPAESEVAGDREVVATLTGRVKDDLRGGYVFIYDATIDNSQMRGIVGNDVSGAATTKLHLDAVLQRAVTANAGGLEIFDNPYKSLTHVANEYTSCMGVPAVNMAAGAYGWIQTWGPAFISPGEDIDDPAAGERNLVFGANYVLFLNSSKTSGQNAGFYLNSGSAAIAGPLIMLQISP